MQIQYVENWICQCSECNEQMTNGYKLSFRRETGMWQFLTEVCLCLECLDRLFHEIHDTLCTREYDGRCNCLREASCTENTEKSESA